MSKDLSSKYYQDNKERLKKLKEDIKVFLKKKKNKKNKKNKMFFSDAKTYQKMKNKSRLSIKKYCKKSKNASL